MGMVTLCSIFDFASLCQLNVGVCVQCQDNVKAYLILIVHVIALGLVLTVVLK